MMEKLRIPYPVVVEGRYDELRLQTVLDAQIVRTDGFGVFKKREILLLLRRLSEKTPLILLTDSDGAGKLIRSHLSSAIPPERLIQLYIPRIPGKEKRKARASAEGTLGVEGMESDLLYRLFEPFAGNDPDVRRGEIEKADFYAAGLTGLPDSKAKRDKLAAVLGLPAGLTPNALLRAVQVLCTRAEFEAAAANINEN